ncbi:MAG TPA: ATP-binding protein [Planctomycetota bacterium]|nr:ATP-binding protein [Planctomycetota bacterium]
MSAGELPELRLDLPAAHSAARMARRLVREFALRGGLDDGEVDNLLLVADELLSNAVDHGGGGAALDTSEVPGEVTMQLVLVLRDGGWVLDVADEGGGDPEELDTLLHPSGLPDLEDERGRGFFLISGLCQSLSVRRREDGKGLVVTAVRLHGPHP